MQRSRVIVTTRWRRAYTTRTSPASFFSFFLQDVAVHYHEFHLRETAGGCVHRLRDKRGGHAQAAPLLLRGILHVPVRCQHLIPALRVLLPAPRKRLLLEGQRHATPASEAAQTAQGAQGEEQEEGQEGQGAEVVEKQEGVSGQDLSGCHFDKTYVKYIYIYTFRGSEERHAVHFGETEVVEPTILKGIDVSGLSVVYRLECACYISSSSFIIT